MRRKYLEMVSNDDFFNDFQSKSFLNRDGKAIKLNEKNDVCSMKFNRSNNDKTTIKSNLYHPILINKVSHTYFIRFILSSTEKYKFLLYDNGLSSNFLFCSNFCDNICELPPYIGYTYVYRKNIIQNDNFTIQYTSKGLLDDLILLNNPEYIHYFAVDVLRLLKFSSKQLEPTTTQNPQHCKIIHKTSIEIAMLIMTSERLRSDKSSIITYIEFYKLKNENDYSKLLKMLLIMFFPLCPSLFFPKNDKLTDEKKFKTTKFNEDLDIKFSRNYFTCEGYKYNNNVLYIRGTECINKLSYTTICKKFEELFEKSPQFESVKRLSKSIDFFDILKDLFYISKKHKINEIFENLQPYPNPLISEVKPNFKKIVANCEKFSQYRIRKPPKFYIDCYKKWSLLYHQKIEKLNVNGQIEIENSEKRNSKDKKSKVIILQGACNGRNH